jgi:putative hydrolase of the HAD superfamily
MIKAVLFDFGGVLTESGKRGFIGETLSQLYGTDKPIDMGAWRYKMYTGQADDDAFFAALDQQYGGPVSKQMFLDLVHHEFHPAKAVYAMAARLRDAGIRTGILSNIFGMNAHELQRQGWYDGFEPLILSFKEGYAKPDPQLYEIALKRLGLTADEVLFVDDQDVCLDQAQRSGLHIVKALSPDQIVRDVELAVGIQKPQDHR